jgi:3-hydroxyisobutyrate dehydrogenase-like beta-hydroxyacid dehydrogenase
MCKNIVQKGSLQKPLIIYNRTTARATALAESLGGSIKAKVASTVADAVQPADIIFICLGDDPAVESVVQAALDSGAVKGKLFVDCSTIHPDTTRKINETLRAKGASFVACPVFGAPAFADAGTLICVLAGPKEDVDRVKPYTVGVVARANIDFGGEDVGKAATMKLLGNSFIISCVATLGEGMVLAEKSGLGTEPLKQWLELMFPGALSKYALRMDSGDYYQREEPLFAVDLARKDAGHGMDLAQNAGMRMRGLEVADSYLKEVKEHAGAKGDIAGIYGAVRKESGLKYENQ